MIDVKALRKKLGLNCEELGVKLGVSGHTIWNWETGKARPSRLALRQLERLYRRVEKKDENNHR